MVLKLIKDQKLQLNMGEISQVQIRYCCSQGFYNGCLYRLLKNYIIWLYSHLN